MHAVERAGLPTFKRALKGPLNALRDVHRKAEDMADRKRQMREAHRERDRLAASAMVRELKQQEAGRAAMSRLRTLTDARSKDAFARSQSSLRGRGPLPPGRGGPSR